MKLRKKGIMNAKERIVDGIILEEIKVFKYLSRVFSGIEVNKDSEEN
jgi:hypothetical protein